MIDDSIKINPDHKKYNVWYRSYQPFLVADVKTLRAENKYILQTMITQHFGFDTVWRVRALS